MFWVFFSYIYFTVTVENLVVNFSEPLLIIRLKLHCVYIIRLLISTADKVEFNNFERLYKNSKI